jgi:Predicted O-methyltransferase
MDNPQNSPDPRSMPDLRSMYIDLLKKALSFQMWDEAMHSVDSVTSRKLSHRILKIVDALIRPLGGVVAIDPKVTQAMRDEGSFWPGQAHTMIGQARLDNLRMAVETVISEGVPGDFIETGVWRGGACIFMRGLLEAHGDTARKVFVADSFAGLPEPEPDRYPADKADKLYRFKELAIPKRVVEDNFRKYGLLDSRVQFVEGFFADTLHKLDNPSFAIIRLDGDMYSSTIQALDALYPKLSSGGFCIIDDYSLSNCRQAVTEYRAAHGITAEMIQIDWTGTYWRKP